MAEEIRVVNQSGHCSSHEYVEKNMSRLEAVAEELSKGQTRIITVMHDISRMGERIEKLEKNQDEIMKKVLKISGGIAVLAFIAPMILKFL